MTPATQPDSTPYVALYVRISVDKEKRREGVDRQEKWGRAYAAAHWPAMPVRVFADNNVSAFDDDAVRPGYDALRAAVLAGEVAHIWTVEMTRLEANRLRWVELTILFETVGIEHVHTNREGIVTLDEVADVKNIFAYRERKRLRDRLHDTLNDLADEGRPRSGATYGYSHGVNDAGQKTLDVVPVEAAVLRWMAGVLRAGWSLAEISRRLNEFNAFRLAFGLPACLPKRAGRPLTRRGEVGVVSAYWVPAKVRSVLTKPAVAGRRVHKKKDHGDGTWEPILDTNTWGAVCRLLGAERDVTGSDGKRYTVGIRRPPSRDYPLTGFLDCGICDWRLNGKGRKNPSGWQRRYACIRVKGAKSTGCGGTTIVAEALEGHVYGELLARLRSPEFLAMLNEDAAAERRDELTAAISNVEHSRLRRAREWGEGKLADDEWDAARAGLAGRKAELTAELAALPPPPTDVDPEAIVEGWDEMTDDERRHVLGLWVTRITIGRPTPGIRWFDPARVTIDWR